MATSTTATRRLLDHLLDGQLDTFVLDRRALGQPWRIIARDLHAATGEDITPEALRSWYAQDANLSGPADPPERGTGGSEPAGPEPS